MSRSFHRFTEQADPLGNAAVEAVFGIEKSGKEQDAAEAASKQFALDQESANAAAEERLRVKQVGTRGQELRAAAAAAGATRSGNEADLLTGAPRRKRKDASTDLLGG